MNDAVRYRPAAMRDDYRDVVGGPFAHFCCPILFRDEAAGLSHAHIVNYAFTDSDRRWTVRRSDVDNYFGSLFERNFVLLGIKGKQDPVSVLLDRDLSRKLRPCVMVDGQAIDHYLPDGEAPKDHSELEGEWQVVIEKDLRRSS